MDGRGNAMLVGAQHLPGLQVLRAVLPGRLQGQVRHRHQLRAARSADIPRRDSGEGATEKLRQYDIYRQMLADHFNEPADKAMQQGRAVREGGQGAVRQAAGPDAAADRGRQAADRLRRAARHLPLHRQEDARPRPVPGHLPRQPARRRRQGLRLHRRLPRPVQLAGERHHRLHQRRASTATRRRTSKACWRTASRRRARTSTRPWRRSEALCEPVAPPKDTLQYQHYFCAAGPGNAEQLKANEPKRVELYKAVAALLRAYANLANEMAAAGYSDGRDRRDQGRGRSLRARSATR